MSRGFRDADETQAMSDRAVASAIDRLLEAGGGVSAGGSADGRCVDCGAEIGEERRRALPTAARCISCQAAWEASGRR